MTKIVDKIQDSATSKAKPTQEELEVAYRVHTLSQMIYGHLAMTQQHPWIGAPLPVTAFWPQLQTPAGYMPMFPH